MARVKGCVLIPRPLGVARDMAARLAVRGWASFIEPLLTVTPIDVPLPDFAPFTALAFTSRHGVEEFAARTPARNFRVYAVGRETAQRAREAGFTDVLIAGDGNVKALNHMLAAQDARNILHVSGRNIAGEVVAGGQPVERLVLYAAHPVTALSEECCLRLASGEITHAVFFSRRTGETFAALIGAHLPVLAGIRALALSDSVLESVASLPWRAAVAARTPDWAGILALLEEGL